MDKISGKLTVFFEEPFWIGVFERHESGKLWACRVVFGSESRENQVYEFISKNYYGLQFSPAVKEQTKKFSDNPKRRQREAHKLLSGRGTGTKAQQALQLQREQMKIERTGKNREEKRKEEQRKFELKRQKKKEKHRGR